MLNLDTAKSVDLPFQAVDINTFSPFVISECAKRLQTIMEQVEILLQDVSDGARLEQARSRLTHEDLAVVERFVFLGTLMLVAFGPARLDNYQQFHLKDILRCVKRHIRIAYEIGLLERSIR
jgi:hypothetical protein